MDRRGFVQTAGGLVVAAAGLGGCREPAGWDADLGDLGEMPGLAASVFPSPGRSVGVRLDTNNPTPPFNPEGGQGAAPGPTSLRVEDASSADILNYWASDPGASGETDLVAEFQIISTSPAHNIDTGVRFRINDGGRSIVGACVVLDGLRSIGLANDGAFTDRSTYPACIRTDWTLRTSIRLRRTAGGHAQLVELHGVPLSPPPTVPRALLRGPPRAGGPTIEFGCAGVEAGATTEFYAIRSERVVALVLGELRFRSFRIRDVDSTDRVRFRADLLLGGGTDGIDPLAAPVWVRLSTPGGGQFYPLPEQDFNPINGFEVHRTAPRRHWSLTPAERARTGIERLDIGEAPDNTGAVVLRDRRTSVPSLDYSRVNVEIVIGNDCLTGTAELVERPSGSGGWRLGNE